MGEGRGGKVKKGGQGGEARRGEARAGRGGQAWGNAKGVTGQEGWVKRRVRQVGRVHRGDRWGMTGMGKGGRVRGLGGAGEQGKAGLGREDQGDAICRFRKADERRGKASSE